MITEFVKDQPVEILLTQKKVVGKGGRTLGDFDPQRGKTGVMTNSFCDQRGLRMVEVKLDAPNIGSLWLMPSAVSYTSEAVG